MTIGEFKDKGLKIMTNLNVFETFSGIGSQAKALAFCKDRFPEFNFKIVYTSDWYCNAIFGYVAIHNLNNTNKYLEYYNEDYNKILTFIKNNTFSFDSKNEAKNILAKGEPYLRKLYASCKVTNNLIDIRKIRGSDLTTKIDLLTYSFPCQDLSVCGKNLGMKQNSNTRSSLLWHVLRILNELKKENKLPKFLLMENVIAIKSSKNINDLELFKNLLNDLGYQSFEYIENAIDHNIPQNRKRFFLLSILNKNDNFIIKPNKQILTTKLFDLIDNQENLRTINHHDLYLNKILSYNYQNPECLTFNKLNVSPKFNQANYVYGIKTKYVSTITFSGENSRHRILFRNGNNYVIKYLNGYSNLRLMGFSKNDYYNMIAFGISDEAIRKLAGNSIVVFVLVDIFLSLLKYKLVKGL